MKRKRTKDYWEKRTERFADGAPAQSRAGSLRTCGHVSHVTVRKDGDAYVVTYSVARWYLEELHNAGGKL
ncbi:MAG: hypothetical protein V2A79_05290 [Planctomycetota bacterium]